MLEFDDESVRPRRLIHVPTMASYPWAPGDVYGGHLSPYVHSPVTRMGRWRLGEEDYPSVKALPILVVTWVIPRVHPSHFTVEEFEHPIKVLADTQPHRFQGKFKLRPRPPDDERLNIPTPVCSVLEH